MPIDLTLLSPLSACVQAQERTMSVAAWICHLPDVHPFFVDMAQTLDRTIARLERRLSSLHAEAAPSRLLSGPMAAPRKSRPSGSSWLRIGKR